MCSDRHGYGWGSDRGGDSRLRRAWMAVGSGWSGDRGLGRAPTGTGGPGPLWRGRLVLAGLALIVAMVSVLPQARAGVLHADPYWFQDTYRTSQWVQVRATTASGVGDDGGVRLAPAPLALAMQPHGRVVLAATTDGVQAFVSSPAGMQSLVGWHLTAPGVRGVAWLHGGGSFALATSQQIAVYGETSAVGAHPVVRVATADMGGVRGLAAGPATLGAAVLAATDQSVVLLDSAGTGLQVLSGGVRGLAGNLGVASNGDGSVIATWTAQAVQLWVWDGVRYVAAPLWDPPLHPDGRVVGVALARRSRVYWVLTARRVAQAYAYGTAGAFPLAGLSIVVPPGRFGPRAISTGWTATGVAIASPDGWRYAAAVGTGMAWESRLGLSGERWPAYRKQSTVESTILPLGHAVTQLRVEDANCTALGVCQDGPQLPAGTALAYRVATEGCTSWNAAEVAANFTLPLVARDVCYRLRLSTVNPRRTPVVHVTNIYEIALVSDQSRVAALLCALAGCGG